MMYVNAQRLRESVSVATEQRFYTAAVAVGATGTVGWLGLLAAFVVTRDPDFFFAQILAGAVTIVVFGALALAATFRLDIVRVRPESVGLRDHRAPDSPVHRLVDGVDFQLPAELVRDRKVAVELHHAGMHFLRTGERGRLDAALARADAVTAVRRWHNL